MHVPLQCNWQWQTQNTLLWYLCSFRYPQSLTPTHAVNFGSPQMSDIYAYYLGWSCCNSPRCVSLSSIWREKKRNIYIYVMKRVAQARLEVTEMKKICVSESVRRCPNPTLYMSQPALLCVTAETLVNRLMWQISTATLHFNPVILHQRVRKNLFSRYS